MAEKLLRDTAPTGKPERGDTLMLFEDPEYAKPVWAHKKDGVLYEVEISEEDILHRGDMETFNKIAKTLEAGGDATDLAHKYWAGEMSDNPGVEIMVGQAVVTGIAGTNEERVKVLRSLVIRNPVGPTQEDFMHEFFKDLISKE